MKKILSTLFVVTAIALAWGSGWAPRGSGGGDTIPDSLNVVQLTVDSTATADSLYARTGYFTGWLYADTLAGHSPIVLMDSLFGSYVRIDTLAILGDSVYADTAYTRITSSTECASPTLGGVFQIPPHYYLSEVDAYLRAGVVFNCFAVLYAGYDSATGPVGPVLAMSDTVTHPTGYALLTFSFDSVYVEDTVCVIMGGTGGEAFRLQYDALDPSTGYPVWYSGGAWLEDLLGSPRMALRGHTAEEASTLLEFDATNQRLSVPSLLSLGGFDIEADADSSWITFPYLFVDTAKVGALRTNTANISGNLGVAAVFNSVTADTTDYVAGTSDYCIILDTSSDTLTCTLPALATAWDSITGNGLMLMIKNIGANPLIIDANASENIDDADSLTLVQWESVLLQATETLWAIF